MKSDEISQFADDTCIISHSITEVDFVYQNTHNYTKQNMLILNSDKTEVIVFFSKDQHHIEQFHYIGSFIKPNVSYRYPAVVMDNKLSFDAELNKLLIKMATATRSKYLVRHFLP